jgi:hypothetical protein
VAIQVLSLLSLRAQDSRSLVQQPLQQQPVQQQDPGAPAKSNRVDPTVKNTDVPDPTKDPSKDPANDITRDPTKDTDDTPQAFDSQNKSLGADAAGDIAPEAPDYTGPAILSRGFALTRPAVPINERFRYYIGVNAIYDSGLTGAYVQNGIVPSVSSGGANINWGLSGKRYRRKDIFDLTYSGSYYAYTGESKYSGQDQSLSAGYTRQISHHISLGFREAAGLYSNTYSVLNSTAVTDTTLASATIVVAPNTEAFDDRTYYTTTSVSLTYQKTARLSFNASMSYFLVRRNSQDLADTSGYQFNGDIAYRITKRQTLGVYYAHTGYSYTKIFGDTNADSIGGNYSISLNRATDLSIRAGVTHFTAQYLENVVPNPLVQAALGITSGIEKYYLVDYAPDFTVTLTRKLRRSSFGATYLEGITPGNGLVLTSKRQAESVYWSLPTIHKYNMQLVGGRDELYGYTTGPQNYVSYYARFTMTKPITRTMNSFMSLDYRNYRFSDTDFHQNEFLISVGFRFYPPEGKFW